MEVRGGNRGHIRILWPTLSPVHAHLRMQRNMNNRHTTMRTSRGQMQNCTARLLSKGTWVRCLPCVACGRCWDAWRSRRSAINQEIGKLQLQELCVLKQGCEDMRMQMEDRVAPVCSDVACACSQALVRRGGNRVFALHVRARTI